MNWKNIRLIFMREVRDLLRDRRTLFMVFVMPLILYPSLGIGMAQMMLVYREQVRTVVVLGEDHLPSPLLLADSEFAGRWFVSSKEAKQLEVISQTSLTKLENQTKTEEPNAATTEELDRQKELLASAAKIQSIHDRVQKLQFEQQLLFLQSKDAANETSTSTEEQAPIEDDSEQRAAFEKLQTRIDKTLIELSEAFSNSNIQVLLSVPEGLSSSIDRDTQRIVSRELNGNSSEEPTPTLSVLHNNADRKSQIAYARVKNVLALWEAEILKRRLSTAKLPESIATPVNPKPVDLASPQELSANIWGTVIPSLLIIMAITGAFYPAVDLAAGEKERGTMETLLICPASRPEIVWGKFFTVLLFSMATAALNLVSLGFTTKYMVSLGSGAGGINSLGAIAPPSFEAICWVILLLIPIAALFSALSFALATFARSTKEGQYYLTPMLAVSTGLTVFCASPAVEITPFYSIMPIIGVGLLLKGLLSSPDHTAMLIYVIPVLITSTGYSLLALWWAIDQFKREGVLFRESEQFNLMLWFKQLLREKLETPTFAEASLCFLLIMFLQFATMNIMQKALGPLDSTAAPHVMLKLLIIQQLAIIATPALIMGIMLTTNFNKTFSLRLPKPSFLLLGLFLPFVVNPLSLELAHNLQWFFPPLPDGIEQVLKTMQDPNIPFGMLLLAFAIAPAICEEIAFRGFILSGLAHHGRLGLAIVFSSLAFGFMHMIPQQVFNASLVGLVLGLLCIRSNSLIPGILFHFVNNGIEVFRSRYAEEIQNAIPKDNPFLLISETEFRYQLPTIIICLVLASMALYWLYKQPSQQLKSVDETP